MHSCRVLLADDHKIVLEGLGSLLSQEFQVVGAVEDGRQLLVKAHELRPDIIIADITMPQLNGIDAVRQIKENGLQTKFIVLTMHQDALYAKRAFDAGASGYVLKCSAMEELVTAIHEVLKGRTYVTPRIAEELMCFYKERPGSDDGELAKLNSRHREILQLLAQGKSAKEIASTLHLSRRTVEYHKYHMMETLRITNTAELIQFAIKQGIVTI
jgi:DNA-binding NarL/FixJ family response regulator